MRGWWRCIGDNKCGTDFSKVQTVWLEQEVEQTYDENAVIRPLP